MLSHLIDELGSPAVNLTEEQGADGSRLAPRVPECEP